jgi:hypothetical protein
MTFPNFSYRKRSREDEQNDGEFFPLSKRINNLHLSPMTNQQFPPVINNHPEHSEAAHQNFHHGAVAPSSLYNPDLKQHENPHYYDTNKVLYELYCERAKRESKMV